jgi:hypothetical protein
VHTLIYWFGFLGAWLLVAGPIYQASVELRAEDEARDRLQLAMDGLPPPPRVSRWWWLLPPVRLVLVSRRRNDYQQSILTLLTPEEVELFTRFMSIVRGWMLVGFGAWLIGLKETYELSEHYEWELWVYWPLVVVMTLVALGLTAVTTGRERSMLAHSKQP